MISSTSSKRIANETLSVATRMTCGMSLTQLLQKLKPRRNPIWKSLKVTLKMIHIRRVSVNWPDRVTWETASEVFSVQMTHKPLALISKTIRKTTTSSIAIEIIRRDLSEVLRNSLKTLWLSRVRMSADLRAQETLIVSDSGWAAEDHLHVTHKSVFKQRTHQEVATSRTSSIITTSTTLLSMTPARLLPFSTWRPTSEVAITWMILVCKGWMWEQAVDPTISSWGNSRWPISRDLESKLSNSVQILWLTRKTLPKWISSSNNSSDSKVLTIVNSSS